ncbi:MAG: transketolase, partial [Stellaceae bacterium]
MPPTLEAGLASASQTDRLACLAALERKVLWLSTWMIHHANHVRPNRDGLKVGGHQASSASMATLMTALYFDVLRPQDRVAVKPHASPVFHAIQYLLGRQSRDKLERFRGYGGAQSYPSRSKDGEIVDFSTGSVGLGVGMTLFSAIVQDYLRLKEAPPSQEAPGRMIALAGDAELDEGNIFEALLEGWKHDVRNLWWVIDYNRQSLDAVVSDRLFGRIDAMFEMMGWRVVTLKYGHLLEAAFARPDGHHLREWIDACPNSLYSALVYKGGAGWREHLQRDLNRYPGIRAILDEHDDAGLQRLMTNLAGHDLESVLAAFHTVADDRPTCFIAYTIKGYGLPFAGHKDNHAGLMNREQMATFQRAMQVPQGAEWEPYAGLDLPPERLSVFLAEVPLAQSAARRHRTPVFNVHARLQ